MKGIGEMYINQSEEETSSSKVIFEDGKITQLKANDPDSSLEYRIDKLENLYRDIQSLVQENLIKIKKPNKEEEDDD
jgi:hypothetical protein